MAPWKITWTSCAYTDQPNNLDGIIALAPKAHWMLGDHSYFAWGYSVFGKVTTDLQWNTAPSVWLDKFEQFIAQPGWQKLLAYRASTGMRLFWGPRGDDHGFGGSNWDHTLAAANASGTSIGAANLAQVLTHWENGCKGHALLEQKHTDNPVTTEFNGDIPSAMVGTATADKYPISYWYTDFVSGGGVKVSSRELPSQAFLRRDVVVRVITIDCTSYKSPIDDPDNAAKQFLGVKQTAWFLAVCDDARASGIEAIIVMSNKDTNNVDNADSWYNYSTAREALLQLIHDRNYPVSWACGDRHYPHVGEASTERGDSFDSVAVCACPFATAQTSQLSHYNRNLWTTRQIDQRCYGVIEVDEDRRRLRYSIVDADTDAEMWSGVIPFGSRKLIA